MTISIRQKKILEILFNVNDVITAEQLCSSINVSPRTIRNDVKEINETFKDKNIEIYSKKGKGYVLKYLDKDVFYSIIKKGKDNKDIIPITQEERAEYINFFLLKNCINNIEYITQIDLADKLYESVSSLKNDIKIAKDKLAEFNLSIGKVSNKGIILEGSEEDIRYYINSNLKQSSIFKEIFDETYNTKIQCITRENISEIIKNNISKFQLRLSDISFSNLLNCIQICILRNSNEKNVNYTKEEMEAIKKESGVVVANSICSDISGVFKITLLEEDVMFIAKYIIASNIVAKDRNEILSNLRVEDLEVYKLVEDIIRNINVKFGVNLAEDDILKDFLMCHLKTAIKRSRYRIQTENDMLDIIKKNHPFTFSMAILANNLIQEAISVSLCEGDLGFLSLHFEASVRRLEISKDNKFKKVMVVCSTGAGTSLLIKVKLEKYFGNKLIIVDTIPWYEFDERLLELLDFVITTIPLKNIDQNKVVYVKNLLDTKELLEIKEKIKGNNISDISLEDRFKEEIFFSNVNLSSRNDIINYITDNLIEKGYINDEIKNEFFYRESISTTEIGNLVAIPHTMHSDIKKSFILVLILDKSILWNKEQVQMVLLIGMAKNEQRGWKSSLERLYRNIVDMDKALSLIKSTKFSTFINEISKFE